ncbi:MAG: CopG family transcriptional regulator [Scytonema sp. PMC 1069.18]|nr:CopG family transcriptional regulator [Scytonema sp. PMC 1069.18]MEC4881070.1 CopG family transcriptional regulator [Scytonema sp. PMC 1070.18]
MVHFNLDLSPELNDTLEELAGKIGVTKSDVLRQAITLMELMVTAKEKGKKVGIAEPEQALATEINIPYEDIPKTHPLETFMESFGVWEDERTPEEIIKDIYDRRTTSS